MKMKTILLSSLAAFTVMGTGVFTANLVSGDMAYAQSASAKATVDDAIADGTVGETAAGYLALTGSSASASVTNAMNEVNIGRKTVYTRLAREQNVQIEVVAALTGEKQLAKAEAGTKIMNKQGKWVTVQ